MLTEITTALASINSFRELAKTALQLNASLALTEQAIGAQSAIIELQSTLMGIQSQYQSLLQEKDELKKQLAEMENWEHEAAKYELKDVGGNLFAYVFKRDIDPTTPPHWLCANCYQSKKKSILQTTSVTANGLHMNRCPSCKMQINVRRSVF